MAAAEKKVEFHAFPPLLQRSGPTASGAVIGSGAWAKGFLGVQRS